MSKLHAQTIALAGVLQSANLVNQIANTGNVSPEAFNPSISSLFQFDADSAEAIYGGIHGVKLGLQTMSDVLGGANRQEHQAVIRYAMGLLHLQQKVARDSDMLSTMRSRLEHAAIKAEHFSDHIDSTAASIAAIYQDTVSTLTFRIQVSGSVQQLQNPRNAEKIRALLLAGIRAGILWRQSGGRRWHLLFKRGKLLNHCRDLLEHL